MEKFDKFEIISQFQLFIFFEGGIHTEADYDFIERNYTLSAVIFSKFRQIIFIN